MSPCGLRSVVFAAMVASLVPMIHWGRGAMAAAPLSIEAYRQSIEQCAGELDGKDGMISRAEVRRLEACLDPDLRVRTEEGQVIRVDGESWARRVREAMGRADGRQQLLVHLRALQEQISMQEDGLPVLPGTWTKQMKRLDEIYRLKEFRNLRPRGTPFWIDALRRAFEGLVRWLEAHLPSPSSTRVRWFPWVVYGLILMMGLLAVVWLLRSLRIFGWERASSPLSRGGPPPASPPDWREWRGEAQRKADKGEYREAIRCLFLSILLEGQARGWWRYEPHATNKEHLSRMETSSKRTEAFKQLMDRYERTWYGLIRPSEAEYRACEGWVRHMEGYA